MNSQYQLLLPYALLHDSHSISFLLCSHGSACVPLYWVEFLYISSVVWHIAMNSFIDIYLRRSVFFLQLAGYGDLSLVFFFFFSLCHGLLSFSAFTEMYYCDNFALGCELALLFCGWSYSFFVWLEFDFNTAYRGSFSCYTHSGARWLFCLLPTSFLMCYQLTDWGFFAFNLYLSIFYTNNI